MEILCKHLRKIFKHYHVAADEQLISELAEISYEARWTQDALFRTYATELDQTQLYYMIPDRYYALCKMSKRSYPGKLLTIGHVELFVFGLTAKKPKFTHWIDPNWGFHGFFWNNVCTTDHPHSLLCAPLEYIGLSKEENAMFRFAYFLDKYMKENHKNFARMKQAFDEGYEYFTLHRKIVAIVTKVLGLSDFGHDLTKDRLVLAALAYAWHFPEEHKTETMKSAALEVIKLLHTTKENHHPESSQDVDWDLLFSDRISVHLVKSKLPVYENRGFDVLPHFIPEEGLDKWESFKNRFKNINLWDHVLHLLPNKLDIDTDNRVVCDCFLSN